MGLVELMFNDYNELIRADNQEKVEAKPVDIPKIFDADLPFKKPRILAEDFFLSIIQSEYEIKKNGNADAFCLGVIIENHTPYVRKCVAAVQYYKLK